MFPARHARLFEYVHPVFWPWLWLQLWALGKWQRETGRDLLITVTRHGTVTITHVSDAPAPDSLYRYAPPAIPAWDRPALASGLPPEFSGELLGLAMPLRAPAPVCPQPAFADTS